MVEQRPLRAKQRRIKAEVPGSSPGGSKAYRKSQQDSVTFGFMAELADAAGLIPNRIISRTRFRLKGVRVQIPLKPNLTALLCQLCFEHD